jgi:tetratricopeptide (TPR) repeat protein
LRNGEIKQVALKSEPWQMAFNWAYNKTASPTGNEVITIFDKEIDSLPLYLSNVVPSRVPYWFRYIPDDRMIYFQYNDVTNGSGESFTDFTSRLFEMYDTHEDKIDKFVIDLRFNEGGDGSLLPPLVREFVLRDDSFDRGILFIITGSNTFSAAPNFIGKMLKNTSVITVGEIAAGPLNWCSDIIKFSLPNSKLMINISTMAWQEGHPTDNRGYYPPDYYVPTVSVEYFSFVDPVLEAIRENKVSTLKDILYNEGCEPFWSEYQVRKEAFAEQENWFPYNSFDLLLYAFQSLAAAGKIDESMAISELNTTLYPDKIRAWYILAMMHEAKGEFMEALECYNILLSIEPDYTEAIWERDKMKALADTSELDASLLKLYSGQYGERSIIQEDNILYYQGSGSKMKLIPISEDYFLIDGSNTRINFMLESGACIAIKMLTYNGSSKTYMRSGE